MKTALQVLVSFLAAIGLTDMLMQAATQGDVKVIHIILQSIFG